MKIKQRLRQGCRGMLIVLLLLLVYYLIPPTPRPSGSRREFEGSLSDLDWKYRFLFTEGSKVELVDLSGKTIRTLVDTKTIPELKRTESGYSPVLSPKKQQVILWYSRQRPNRPAAKLLLIVDINAGKSRVVRLPPHMVFIASGSEAVNSWLDETTFVVTARAPRPNLNEKEEFVHYLLPVDDPEHPKPLKFPVRPCRFFQDPHTKAVLFCDADKPVKPEHTWVLSSKGIHRATPLQAWKYQYLRVSSPMNSPSNFRYERVPFWKLWVCLKVSTSHWDFFINDRFVHRAVTRGFPDVEWEPELGLYLWSEGDYGEKRVWYFMNGGGHVQRWRSGWYGGFVPRLPTDADHPAHQ